jgi:small subunit ribosomal protein S3
MGQKVNPKGLRIGIIRTWDSKWFANKNDYKKLLHLDIQIRKFVKKYFKEGHISRVEILRDANMTKLIIHSSRPGTIIGRQGEGIEKFQETLVKKFRPHKFNVSVKEIKNPDVDAYLVAENIARQITRRVSYRRAIRTAIQRAQESGAKGVKVGIKGRLNGVEIARSEMFTEGKIPLHTLRANIDYASFPAWTTYGIIGVKVWIYKGEVFNRVSEMVADGQKNEADQHRNQR